MLIRAFRRWWKWMGVLLIAWHFFFIASWHNTQVNESAKYEYGNLPLNPEPKRESPSVGELQTKQLRKNKSSSTESTQPINISADKSLSTESGSGSGLSAVLAIKAPPSSTEKPHLVICAKTEEYLLPIAKYFTIHRLIDGYNGLPPWNSSTLLLVDSPLCADDPYIKESFARRSKAPFVDTSHDVLNGKWNQGVYFPNTTKKFMREIKDRPALMRARGEVFWRSANTDCSDVDFVWDRQVETPSDSCFTIHYLQGVTGSYSRTDEGELGVNETTAIYQGKVIHPQRPKGDMYDHFCSFLIRSDPDDLVEMFREKNYDVDVLVRHMFFKQLSEYKQCDRVIGCPGNPNTSYKCFAGYKFHITFENSLVNGYISEEVFNGALGGGIPIYFGAADIGSYVNEKSVLHCNVNRSVIEEMRTFYPRESKTTRRFKLNNSSSWPTQQELLKWADGYLRKELEPCVQRAIELDQNESAYREVLNQPFVTNLDIMDGMYPLRGIKFAQDALTGALTSSPLSKNDSKENSQSDEGEPIHSRDLAGRDLISGRRWCPWKPNDQIVNSPCDLQLLLRLLISRVPFSFAHFNDGEVLALKRNEGKTDRGMQDLSPRLQQAMQHAFYQNKSGLVYGLPCREQFKSASEFAVESLKDYVNINKTQATLFIDGNYQIAREVLLEYLLKNQQSITPRNVRLIVGDKADMGLFHNRTGLTVEKINVIRVPSTNAFPQGYDDNIDKWQEFEPDDIVIICAGPLGRILAVEWFVLANRTTYMELGSFFDMDLYGTSFGANYYDGNKESICNEQGDKSWFVQKDRLLGMIKETKDPIASETNIAATFLAKHISIHNLSTIEEARNYQLAHTNSSTTGASKYTIRMNTWRRNEQLRISVNHHAKCEGVASIQIIWCDIENEPPEELANHESGKVVIERHDINSLNERYRILEPTPTLAVLSIDDDVLRPCEALDAAFIRWTRHPDRLVGFDARSVVGVEYDTRWMYSGLNKNKYSLTLSSKSAFIHRDYLDLYISTIPGPILQHIDSYFNCEDIAMSYFVSTMTKGKPPLLSDHWTMSTVLLELHSTNGLSRKDDHIDSRSVCINVFAELLGLKKAHRRESTSIDTHALMFGIANHSMPFCFGYGDEPECWSNIDSQSFSHTPRLQKLVEELQWRESLPGGELAENNTEWFAKMKADMVEVISRNGSDNYTTLDTHSAPSSVPEFFCQGKGSLHQVALDLMNYSSPRGSPSHNKLKYILDAATHFYIDKPGYFFTHTSQSISRMLQGYGLQKCDKKSSCLHGGTNDSVILVDSFSWRPKSPCPLRESKCLNQPRIIIQSEQAASNAFKDMVLKELLLCNESPTCIVWEFSEHTYNQLQGYGLWNSTILLPIMTQSPSRLSSFEPAVHKELKDRKHAFVFFGYLGWRSQRRRDILEQIKSYPADWNIIYEQSQDGKVQADSYKDAKVCLIPHAYYESGGEYHRLSEFGPFGCVPVLEQFADTIGIESYRRCGGAIFTNYSNLLNASEDVIYKIDHGLYDGPSVAAIVAWWKAGVQWESILDQLK